MIALVLKALHCVCGSLYCIIRRRTTVLGLKQVIPALRNKIAFCSCAAVLLIVFFKCMSSITYDDSNLMKVLEITHRYRDEPKTVLKRPKPYEVTLVTLYMKIESFQKGRNGKFYTYDKYKGWMQTFGWLTNKLVAFLGDDETYEYFKKIRSHFPPDRTVLVRINRSDLSAFKHYDKINQIYSAASYPKHYPNTINANYSVVVNSKYHALQMAMDLGHVDTEYIAWMDIGIFRNLLQASLRPKNDSFTLEVPLDLDPTKIAFSELRGRDALKDLSPWDYVRMNQVWAAGGFLVGKKELVQKFILGYEKTLQSMLKDNMIDTDEQVIGAMYSPQFIKDQAVEIKTYNCIDGHFGLHGSDVKYFCLPYICKEAAELRKANTTSS